MTTVLQYLVIAAVIGLVVFGLAVVVFGRGEQLAPLSPRSSPTELPDRGIVADDVRKMRFAMSLRGYRMSDVDWALERVAGEIDRLRAAVTDLGGDPDPATAAPTESDLVLATVGAAQSTTQAVPEVVEASPGGPILSGGASTTTAETAEPGVGPTPSSWSSGPRPGPALDPSSGPSDTDGTRS